MEKDNEAKGEGNSYDFGARIYDSRLGRWMSIDPLSTSYSDLSPYSFVANSPISLTDPDGKKIVDANGNEVKVTIVKTTEGTVKTIAYEFAAGTSQAVKDQFYANAGKIFEQLGKTKTGTKQLEKARDSKYKEAFELFKGRSTDDHRENDGRSRKSVLGWTSIKFNLQGGKVKHKPEKVITHIIYTGGIEDDIKVKGNKYYGLTLDEAIGAVAGHEIEHATPENIAIIESNYNKTKPYENPEDKPNEIGHTIREELKAAKTKGSKSQPNKGAKPSSPKDSNKH